MANTSDSESVFDRVRDRVAAALAPTQDDSASPQARDERPTVVGREEVGQSAIVGSGTASQISQEVQEPAVEPSASALGVGVGVGSASDPLLAGAEEDRPAATDPFDAVRERVLGETATETATGVDTAPQTDTATAGASATDSRAEPVVEPI